MKRATIDGVEYFTRKHPGGYGYQIMRKEKIGEDRNRYHQIFRCKDSDMLFSFFKRFEDGEVVIKFPDTSGETYPEKILVFRSKHFTAHYSVPTYEVLDKTYRKILKEEYKDQIEHIKPENSVSNKSGVKSLEEIESIPVLAVREDVQRKWDDYVRVIKENARYSKDYMNLRAVVLHDKGNSFNAIAAFEDGYFELEDLIFIT